MSWGKDDFTATQWLLVAITLAMVCTRVYVRVTTVYRPWREILVVLAWTSGFYYAIIQTLMFQRYHLYDAMLGVQLPDEEFVTLWRLNFMFQFSFPNGINCCKAVLLLTFHDLAPRHLFPKVFWLMVVTWAVVIGGGLGTGIIWPFLLCYPKPISTWWFAHDQCISEAPFLMGVIWVAVISELLIFLIPILIISQLKNLSVVQRVGITAMFGVGLINLMLMTFFMYIELKTWFYPQNTWSMGMQGWMFYAEVFMVPTALAVVCIPQMRVLGRWKLARRVVDSISTRVSRGTSMRGGGTEVMASEAAPVELQGGLGETIGVIDEEKGMPVAVTESADSSAHRVAVSRSSTSL